MRETATILGALMLTAFALAPSGASVTSQPFVPTLPDGTLHYMVGFDGKPTVQPGQNFHGALVLNVNDVINFATVEVQDPTAFFTGMNTDNNVLYYEPDLVVVHAALVPNDPQYTNQYDMKPATINAEAAWDKSLGSTAVKLCIVDTGQDRTHEDLKSLTFFYWKDEVSRHPGPTPYDDHGHGTHVTGTAAAKINNNIGVAGLASGSSVGAVKVLDKNGSGTWSQVANGVTDCGAAGAHIESLSLGGNQGSTTLQNAVNSFLNGGGFMSAAAGNSGPCTNCVGYPAKYAGVTAVSCSDANNAFCGFSSQGPEVSLIAPGDSVLSTVPTGNCALCDPSGYLYLSGTSMSTPHVAGIAALYKATHSTATGSQIQSGLKAGAKNLGLSSDRQGSGLLQGTVV